METIDGILRDMRSGSWGCSKCDHAIRIERREVTDWKAVEEVKND